MTGQDLFKRTWTLELQSCPDLIFSLSLLMKETIILMMKSQSILSTCIKRKTELWNLTLIRRKCLSISNIADRSNQDSQRKLEKSCPMSLLDWDKTMLQRRISLIESLLDSLNQSFDCQKPLLNFMLMMKLERNMLMKLLDFYQNQSFRLRKKELILTRQHLDLIKFKMISEKNEIKLISKCKMLRTPHSNNQSKLSLVMKNIKELPILWSISSNKNSKGQVILESNKLQ